MKRSNEFVYTVKLAETESQETFYFRQVSGLAKTSPFEMVVFSFCDIYNVYL